MITDPEDVTRLSSRGFVVLRRVLTETDLQTLPLAPRLWASEPAHSNTRFSEPQRGAPCLRRMDFPKWVPLGPNQHARRAEASDGAPPHEARIHVWPCTRAWTHAS